MPEQAPIILTTDFGVEDVYVGVLKGVILSINRTAAIVDLTHSIRPQDIHQAAVIIHENYRYFPEGSVHLCIVDPGVGTDRKIIAVRAYNQFFVGPDNGVFSKFLTADQPVAIYQVTNRSQFLGKISKTFHGRDIIAPIAARISSGISIDTVGPQLGQEDCVTILFRKPEFINNRLLGEIESVDRFGNLITNIVRDDLKPFNGLENLQILLKSHVIIFNEGSYGDSAENRAAALLNSSERLEICVRNGSAADQLHAQVGEQVVVQR